MSIRLRSSGTGVVHVLFELGGMPLVGDQVADIMTSSAVQAAKPTRNAELVFNFTSILVTCFRESSWERETPLSQHQAEYCLGLFLRGSHGLEGEQNVPERRRNHRTCWIGHDDYSMAVVGDFMV